jgi:hypothetical protein
VRIDDHVLVAMFQLSRLIIMMIISHNHDHHQHQIIEAWQLSFSKFPELICVSRYCAGNMFVLHLFHMSDVSVRLPRTIAIFLSKMYEFDVGKILNKLKLKALKTLYLKQNIGTLTKIKKS